MRREITRKYIKKKIAHRTLMFMVYVLSVKHTVTNGPRGIENLFSLNIIQCKRLLDCW